MRALSSDRVRAYEVIDPGFSEFLDLRFPAATQATRRTGAAHRLVGAQAKDLCAAVSAQLGVELGCSGDAYVLIGSGRTILVICQLSDFSLEQPRAGFAAVTPTSLRVQAARAAASRVLGGDHMLPKAGRCMYRVQ